MKPTSIIVTRDDVLALPLANREERVPPWYAPKPGLVWMVVELDQTDEVTDSSQLGRRCWAEAQPGCLNARNEEGRYTNVVLILPEQAQTAERAFIWKHAIAAHVAAEQTARTRAPGRRVRVLIMGADRCETWFVGRHEPGSSELFVEMATHPPVGQQVLARFQPADGAVVITHVAHFTGCTCVPTAMAGQDPAGCWLRLERTL